MSTEVIDDPPEEKRGRVTPVTGIRQYHADMNHALGKKITKNTDQKKFAEIGFYLGNQNNSFMKIKK